MDGGVDEWLLWSGHADTKGQLLRDALWNNGTGFPFPYVPSNTGVVS